ncbi:MAG: TraB/GumN family protein, partial [Myxococcota bacterium]|nr:TraB/GumN family protein [Myxococcota bacterium]
AEKELPKGVWRKLDQSDVFVMETDLTKAQAEMASSAKLPEGETLEKKLGEEYWKKLDDRLGGIASQFNSVKPWFIVSILILKMVPEVNGTPPMDQRLHMYAKRQGKKVEHLESPQLQLDILEKTLSIEELKEMLDDFDQQRSDLLAMLEYYRDGDLEGIQKVSFKDRDEKAEMYEILFYKRNEAWVVKIDEYIKQGNVFMAFGAGHLFGPRGVLELLEKQGYKPVRVTPEELANAENEVPSEDAPSEEKESAQ